MASWQQSLLNKLTLEEQFSYLIHDPDNLCSEPVIQQAIQSSPAVMVNYEDPVALRLSYEQWREACASGTHSAFLLIYNKNIDEHLPWDIEQNSKPLDFHVSNVIAEVDASVLRELPSTLYDGIRFSIDTYKPGTMNEQASLSFVLRHIYKIAPEVIQTDVDLVRLLIRKHYLSMTMPGSVEEHLIAMLRLNKDFQHWPLDKLIKDKIAFFGYLQAQWLLYLQAETGVENDLVVPFNDHDIRVFINNLFAEGYLVPVAFEGLPDEHWAQIGIVSETGSTSLEQFKRLQEVVAERFSKLSSQDLIRSADWGAIGQDMGRLKALSYDLIADLTDEQKSGLAVLDSKIEELFSEWIQNHYSSLLNQPSIKTPVILHKVTPWLKQTFVDKSRRVCLLVMDGMGFQQWALVKQHIQESSDLRVQDGYCFAWVPTITSVSRQALFAGKAPFYFANDLLSTTNEGKHWAAFWKEAGLQDKQIGYQKTLEKLNETGYSKAVDNRRVKALGAVINFIDDQMHGITDIGMAGLNATVKTWLHQWSLVEKLEQMVRSGFDVVITADHGSQECVGSGRISDGANAETKGERVRLYNHDHLRAKAAAGYDEAVIEWPPAKSALPADTFPMLSNSQSAFIQKGRNIIGHGGISLHEVVVPLAVITGNENS